MKEEHVFTPFDGCWELDDLKSDGGSRRRGMDRDGGTRRMGKDLTQHV